MATSKNLPGTGLPLDPNVQDAIDEFQRNKARFLREAAMQVLLDDLKEDIRKALKQRGTP